ncbi:hypothetical protein Tco_1115630 [Tanacetum coccineum]
MDGITSMVLLLVVFVVNVTIFVCVFMCTPLMPEESIEISFEVQNNYPISKDDIKKLPLYEYSVDQEDDAKEAKRVECQVCLDGFKDGDKCRIVGVEIERSRREDRFPGDVC